MGWAAEAPAISGNLRPENSLILSSSKSGEYTKVD